MGKEWKGFKKFPDDFVLNQIFIYFENQVLCRNLENYAFL